MNIYLDIETLPSEADWVREEIAKGITCPGNYSKPESIAKWEVDNKPALVEEAVQKTGLDGGYGKVCCIGYAVEDGPVIVDIGADEGPLLAIIKEALESTSRPVIVGHNISFDVRFLFQRCVVNGVWPGRHLFAASQAKPWDKCLGDTMLMWHPQNRVSLPKLCKIIGVEKNDSVDGSQVAQLWKEGKLEEIRSHCRSDVEAVREVHRKLTFYKAA
jgi:hypothetical protein